MKGGANQYMTTFEVVMKYLGILMAVIYVVGGVTVLVRSQTLTSIPEAYSTPLGAALMAYGLFRGYRLYQRYFKKSP
ncbi:MAG TPA: hypothetical protein VFZ52_19565 [Chryseolinea sp.]